MLGNVGPALLNAAGGVDPLALLRRGGAGDSGTLANLISVFSETAIVTSATGFVWVLPPSLVFVWLAVPVVVVVPQAIALEVSPTPPFHAPYTYPTTHKHAGTASRTF